MSVGTKKIKLIVAEDEKITRKILASLFKEEEWIVDFVENGKEALEKIELSVHNSHTYNLLLTDIYMPVMGGLELIVKLKNQNQDIPIIAMTSQGDKRTIIELMRLGCKDYIEKPFDLDVIDLIKEVAQSHKEELLKRSDAVRCANGKIKEYEYDLRQAESVINKAVKSYQSLINIKPETLSMPVEFEFLPLSWLGGDYLDVSRRLYV